jgi:choline dehydrogenase-like flavoprotein
MTPVVEQVLTYSIADLAKQSAATAFDAIIVGGGTAGIVAATTLIENGKRVALVEAGPIALLTHATTTDFRFDPDAARVLRGLLEYRPHLAGGGNFGFLIGCLGGRGLFWNGAAPRFLEHDFSGWPFGLAELAPWYAWAEGEFRVSRDYGAALTDFVCRQLRLNGMQAVPGPFAIDTRRTGDGWIGGTIANAMSILLRSGQMGRAERPRIATRCLAQTILFGAIPDRVRGVTVLDRETGNQHEVFGASVVLACGAFESVQLALASKAPDASGRIGRGVMEHYFGRAYRKLPRGFFGLDKPEAAIAFIPAAIDRPYQIEIHVPGRTLFQLPDPPKWDPGPTDEYAAMIRGFAPVGVTGNNWIEAGPPGAPGAFTVHLSYTPEETATRDRMSDAIDRAGTALGGEPAPVQILAPGASFHEAGGLAMGVDAKRSVTDPFGRFHGCPSLVVMDASCWPAIGAANPHLTIAAMSRRNATQLARDLAYASGDGR